MMGVLRTRQRWSHRSSLGTILDQEEDSEGELGEVEDLEMESVPAMTVFTGRQREERVPLLETKPLLPPAPAAYCPGGRHHRSLPPPPRRGLPSPLPPPALPAMAAHQFLTPRRQHLRSQSRRQHLLAGGEESCYLELKPGEREVCRDR